jgi:hypothetical protein
MSLINDALKRASQSPPAGAAPANPQRPASGPAMQPVQRGASQNTLVIAGLAGLCLIAVAACVLLWSFSGKQAPISSTVAATEPAVPATAALAKPEAKPVQPIVPSPAVAPPAQVQPAPASAPTPAVVAAPQPTAAQVPAAPQPAAVEPVKAAFPTLKLQGLFYSQTRPSTVILNGRSLSVGGSVNGVKVKKIDPESVIVEWQGEQRVLELPQ